jgi:hypothetical protein
MLRRILSALRADTVAIADSAPALMEPLRVSEFSSIDSVEAAGSIKGLSTAGSSQQTNALQ